MSTTLRPYLHVIEGSAPIHVNLNLFDSARVLLTQLQSLDSSLA